MTAKKAAASKATWFATGESGMAKKAQQDQLGQMRRERYAPRFRMAVGEECEVVFLDDDGFYIHEHNLKIGGRWGNYVTCTKDFAPCPVCEQGHKPTYTAYYSAIDTREFTLQKGPNAGKKVKNRRVLFPAKGATINLVRDFQKRFKSLVGRKFHVKRMGDKDPNCGRDFEAKGKVKTASIPKADRDPYKYETVLAPMDEKELASLGFSSSVLGSDPEVGGEVDLDKLTDLV